MSYRNILCAYTGDAAAASGLRYAAAMAQRNGGWLTGVLRHGTSRLEARYAARLPASVIQTLHEADEVLIRQARERFDDLARRHDLGERAQFVQLEAAVGQSLSEFARSFDLIVCGPHVEAPNETHMLARPEQIALQSGRPVLIVPQGRDHGSPPRKAVFAWDGKRAAARAMGDAMPMLAPDAHVTVLTVGRGPALPEGSAERAVAWLRRNGFDAEACYVQGDRSSVPRIIIDTAEARGADMVAMGAFEHSKLGQDIWGGVTAGMLHQAPLPLLMSH